MSYTKNTWSDGDVITSAKLNNIENGIENTKVMVVTVTEYDDGERIVYTADKTYEEIVNAINAGIYVVVARTASGYVAYYRCVGVASDGITFASVYFLEPSYLIGETMYVSSASGEWQLVPGSIGTSTGETISH